MITKFKNYITLSLVGSFLALGACEDRLNIEPAQAVSDELVLDTDARVKAVLIGAYDILSDGDLFGGGIQMNGELLAADDELIFSGTYGDPSQIWRKEITTTNSDVADFWMDSYAAINVVNNVLSALEVVDEEDRAVVEGEAKFIRGLLYFELAKFFGQPYSAGNTTTNLGVPIVLEPTEEINESVNVPRATVEETYNQAIADLKDAEELLPIVNGIYANKVAAAAVLSRVYLQQQNYVEARDAANRGIEYAEAYFNLVPNIEDAFNQTANSQEDILAIQVTTQDGTNALVTFFATKSAGGRADIEIQPLHFERYEEGDLRADLFYSDDEGVRTEKWFNQFANIPLIRLAELYLTRAEANERLNTEVGATPAEDLNLIRVRAGLEPIEDPTLEDIINERFVELAFEGQKIHDIKRLEMEVDGFAYDAELLVYPIPQREINANPALAGQQNPGYE
ncbi:RagB/SusD family nutrient uptake outer membrane protein [Nafulsella turpanensis]|uniref:RagB/SusD family nutrient uptake outer membrane protein n=1 Tax=Nafulsella turpanensis TaxID=1265690 RepID=UPI00034AD57F|nr:RagB/SusD family nutrient uptake outer membrane protein [Nafulsella turpanensis]